MRTDTAAGPDSTAVAVAICGTQLGSGIQPGPAHHDLDTHVGLTAHHARSVAEPLGE